MSTLTRSRRQLPVLATLALVVGLVAGSWMVAEGALSRAADEGVRQGIAGFSGADRGLRVTAPLGTDPDAQDAAVRAAIARSFSALDAPPEVVRTASAAVSVVAPAEPNTTRAGLAMSIEDLEAHAELVAGAWPASVDEVSIQADAAALLEAEVGDALSIDGTPYRVAGLWRVSDPLDARWLGEPQLLAGRDDAGPSALGPIVVDPALLTRLDDAQAQWTIVPDATRIDAADLTTIATAWAQVPSSWRGAVDDTGAIRKSGRLTATIAELDTRVDGLRAIEPVVLVLLGAAALVAALELGRLLAGNRAREIALLWARGRGATEAGVWAGAEAGVVATVGAVLGLGAGTLVLLALGDPVALGAGTVGVALAAVVVAVASCAVAAARQAREGVRAEAAENRLRRAAGPTATVLAIAAAAVAVWQLQLYGTPVTPLADGTSAVDPVAVVAPALAVVAGALLALTLFPFAARLVMRATADRAVPRMLAAHTVARRLRRVAAPLLVLAIAASTVLVAAGFTATWSTAFDRASALRAGAQLSVTDAGAFDARALDAVAGLEGVRSVAPVRRDELVLGDGSGTAVAIAPDAFARLASDAAGTLDTASVAEQLRADLPGPAVPAAARELVVTATLSGFLAPPTMHLLYTDGWGRQSSVRADASGSDGEVVFRAELPPTTADAAGRLLAVDVEAGAASVSPDDGVDVTLDGLGTDAGPLEDAFGRTPWSSLSSSIVSVVSPTGPRGFHASPGGVSVRLSPDPSGAPPVLVSRPLAERYDLEVGSHLSVQTAGSYATLDMQVAGVLPAVPGADDAQAALLDLGVLQTSAVRESRSAAAPDALWLSADDAGAAARALRETLPPGARILTADDAAGRGVVGAAAAALTGVAALCVLLALITLAAVARADHRLRLGDLAVLRALGFRSTQQAAVRRDEWWTVAGYAVAAGAIVGAVVVLLTVPQLASAAVPDAIPGISPEIRIDPVLATAGAVVLIGMIALLVELAAARVRRSSLTALGGEEER